MPNLGLPDHGDALGRRPFCFQLGRAERSGQSGPLDSCPPDQHGRPGRGDRHRLHGQHRDRRLQPENVSPARAAVVNALQRQTSNSSVTYRAFGKGEADPVAPNQNPDGTDNPSGRQRNRRVTVSYKFSQGKPGSGTPAKVHTAGSATAFTIPYGENEGQGNETYKVTAQFRTIGAFTEISGTVTCVSTTETPPATPATISQPVKAIRTAPTGSTWSTTGRARPICPPIPRAGAASASTRARLCLTGTGTSPTHPASSPGVPQRRADRQVVALC